MVWKASPIYHLFLFFILYFLISLQHVLIPCQAKADETSAVEASNAISLMLCNPGVKTEQMWGGGGKTKEILIKNSGVTITNRIIWNCGTRFAHKLIALNVTM